MAAQNHSANDTGRCSRCGSLADLRHGGEWLCPDCYEDEPSVGGHVGTRKETAQRSRERLQQRESDAGI